MPTANELDRQRAHEAVARQRTKVAMPFLGLTAFVLVVLVVCVILQIAVTQRSVQPSS